ncbi:MAG TPA: error-prone DNA polymerase [Burkholderiaceae bacterium]|nr:error-prone DNA polymerase [Burkholderiaceae bacterium]
MSPLPIPPRYAELDCLSNFSFLRGASHPEELIARAAKLGYEALALADDCSLAGVVRAWGEARAHGLKLIMGSRFQLAGDTLGAGDSTTHETDSPQLIVLARNLNGYGNLSEFITLARSASPKGAYAAGLDLLAHPPGNQAHLRGLPDCLVIFRPRHGTGPKALHQQLESLLPLFKGRLWLGLALHNRHDDAQHRATLELASRLYPVPLAAIGGVEMHARSRQPLHDTLAAIRLKTPVRDCGYALRPNAEHHLRHRMALAALYPAEALRETLVISTMCSFTLDELKYRYPEEAVPAGHTAASWLRQETYLGAAKRYPQGLRGALREQLDAELNLITELGYEAYFLTIHDIVRFARQRGILCQGRGSAANSAVCYCLGITEVDPENGNLLFARFISRERNEPPDIDVDFEHDRREEVIQYVYRKYGRRRAAITAVVSTYRTRGALRDSGRALGLDPGLIDSVTASLRYRGGSQALLDELAAHPGLGGPTRTVRLWAALANGLKGFPRHLSQHPGGFVICADNLSRLVPVENAAMPERSVVQWDKDDLDAMGILKVDILALGMLSALRRALELISIRRQTPFTLGDIPPRDEDTYQMIRRADTIGVFQIESRAQMSMLPRLAPRSFYDLVIQVSIVRPGPIQGGMVHPYLQRRQQKAQNRPIPYANPAIERILERTLGVPIFQEQVMQIAVTAADFTPGEADQLRRAMASWRRKGGVDKFHQKLLEGMKKNGYDDAFAQSIVRQLEGFGEYGFPESHAAGFAKLAYCSAWIKRHEPEAFLVALLNSQPMGFYSVNQLIQDARRHRVIILPIDINESGWDTALTPPAGPGRATMSTPNDEPQPVVRLGLHLVKGLSREAGQCIEAARVQSDFSNPQDLAQRARLRRHDMDCLANANALASIAGHRRQARWQAALPRSLDLLEASPIRETEQPELAAPGQGMETIADYEATQFTLGPHPLALLRPALRASQYNQARLLLDGYPDRRRARACGLVTMRQRPQTAKGVIFVSLEDETGTVNVIVRPELAARQRTELLCARLLGVDGVWQTHQGVGHLIAESLTNLNTMLGGLGVRSRDFH